MSDIEGNGFTVSDRRAFTDQGEVKDQAEDKPQEADQAGADQAEASEAKAEAAFDRASDQAEAQAQKAGAEGPLPEMTFATFVFSLSSSALLHLGVIPDPMTGQTEVNLPLAKQTIDLLGILKTKTEGNLEEDEAKLLEGILYDARMRFVEAVRGQKS